MIVNIKVCLRGVYLVKPNCNKRIDYAFNQAVLDSLTVALSLDYLQYYLYDIPIEFCKSHLSPLDQVKTIDAKDVLISFI